MVSGLNLQLIVGAVVASVAFGAGWKVNGWRLNAKIGEVEQKHQDLVIQSQALREQSIQAARAEGGSRFGKAATLSAVSMLKFVSRPSRT